MRKAIKKKEKKHDKHHKYLAHVMHLDGYEINALDEELMFGEPLMAKSSHGKKDDKDDDKEEVYIPAQLVFGVTLTLSFPCM
jgi:hypothetical protein